MSILFIDDEDEDTPFPHPSEALNEPNGLLMIGGKLEPQRLLSAYRQGIFPWYEEGDPVLWWSPDPRCLLWPEEIRIPRSLAKTLRNRGFRFSFNEAFDEVMRLCGELRSKATGPGTWITPRMRSAYGELHRLGHAQSLEVWLEEQLVGGLYGIGVGEVFVGESMFSIERDASKCAMATLAGSGRWRLIDCQIETPHLLSLGAVTVPRAEYLQLLSRLQRG